MNTIINVRPKKKKDRSKYYTVGQALFALNVSPSKLTWYMRNHMLKYEVVGAKVLLLKTSVDNLNRRR